MKAFYLYPQGSFQTPLRSDTLWGMLCWGIRTLYGEKKLEEMLARAEEGKPDFVMSSTFPFYAVTEVENTVLHRFYPMPCNILAQEDEQSVSSNPKEQLKHYRKRKDVKKVNYLTESDFQSALNGQLHKKNLLVSSSAQVKPSVTSSVVTHNTIDRINLSTLDKLDDAGNSAGQLFHNEEFFVRIKDKPNVQSGLFFLVEGRQEEIEMLEAVLRYYRHQGMGANSSAGKGVFRCETEEFNTLNSPVDSDVLMNLSLYHPKNDELDILDTASEKSAYLLETRGGKVGQYLLKRDKDKVPCFKEGSVFAFAKEKAHYGQVLKETHANVNHSVYRNYFGFMIKMKSC